MGANRIRRPDWNRSQVGNTAHPATAVAEPKTVEKANRSAAASGPAENITLPVPQQANVLPQNTAVQKAAPSPTKQPERRQVNSTMKSSDHMSRKIWKINGNKKVIDFNSKLIMAKPEDYANVHGSGGKGHAPNSTIGVVLCDYTKGTGDKSVTVQFNMDVEDITLLSYAYMGIAAGSPYRSPLLPYIREKNNPYAQDKDGFVPVSRIEIQYQPTRSDGSVSNYPWYIAISNYEAPLSKKESGATTHVGSQARNKKTAFINVSLADFGHALIAAERYIRLWEHRMIPVIDQACHGIEGKSE